MLSSFKLSPKTDDLDFQQSVNELLQATSRLLTGTITGLYLAFAVSVSVLAMPAPIAWQVWQVVPALLLAFALSWWLISHSLLTAQLVWQVGLVIVITLSLWTFPHQEIAFFYALLPLMAVVTINIWAGLVAESGVIGLLGWFVYGSSVVGLPLFYFIAVAVAGAIALIIGWAITYSLFTVAAWSIFSLGQARENMEEARSHRAQLLQAQRNLDQAYYQLDRANAALVAAWRAADEAERFKTEFVTNISHELRTPLNLIVGFSEMMMTAPESYGNQVLPPSYRGDMNSIYHSAQHLLALVDDILDMGRIEAGKITLVRDIVDLNLLVTEALELIHDYILAKGLELRIDIAPDLPKVWVDRLRIRQVLLNLLVNASRFTEKGWIKLSICQRDEEILIQVQDTGQGIPQEDLPKIFEPFRSTERPLSTWHSGTGLGLPISRQFVELHHGEMGAENRSEGGACFWFTLPLGLHPEDKVSLSEHGRQLPHVQLESAEAIIVVVHDDPNVITALERYWEGYHLMYAPALNDGLTLASEVKAIALIMDDASTPDLRPNETPNKMNIQFGPEHHCLLIRCPIPSGKRAAALLGADDFLVKPVSRQSLLRALEQVQAQKQDPIRRILVVDDNPEIVDLFERMLKPHPHLELCQPAYNGSEALALMQAEKPDLVLLDLLMPQFDGQTVLNAMAADSDLAGIPVIIISAEEYSQLYQTSRGRIQIDKSGYFQMGEVFQVLEAVFKVMAPGWRQLDARAAKPVAIGPD